MVEFPMHSLDSKTTNKICLWMASIGRMCCDCANGMKVRDVWKLPEILKWISMWCKWSDFWFWTCFRCTRTHSQVHISWNLNMMHILSNFICFRCLFCISWIIFNFVIYSFIWIYIWNRSHRNKSVWYESHADILCNIFYILQKFSLYCRLKMLNGEAVRLFN